METLKRIEVCASGGTGYAPLPGCVWPAALPNYAPERSDKRDVGFRTDEGSRCPTVMPCRLPPGTATAVYSRGGPEKPLHRCGIRRGVWHKIPMRPGRVLVAENSAPASAIRIL